MNAQDGELIILSVLIKMQVTVKLFGGLESSKKFPKNDEGDLIIEFSDSLTVAELIEILSLNKKPFIIIINGHIINNLSTLLNENDVISLFPPIAGGALF